MIAILRYISNGLDFAEFTNLFYTKNMKLFYHLAALSFFLPLLSQAQIVQDDFEGNGTIATWLGDDCGLDTQFPNPIQQGINTSATVLEYDDNEGQYANVRFDLANSFDLSTTYTFSLKIYVPSNKLTGSQTNQVSLKLQDGRLSEPWSTQSEIIKPLVLDSWQTVTFDFKYGNYRNLDGNSPPPIQRTDFNRVVIQVNGENNNDKVVAYIDDMNYANLPSNDPVFDKLVWSDEFDGNGAIDNTKWFHQTRIPNGGSWFNGEIQHYTNRQENASVENGTLKLVAKKETFSDQGVTKNYTSARLNSKFAFTYGRVEVRAKLPMGVGTWPAIWMLGKNINETGAYWQIQGHGTTGWPACGEIDIMEHWGKNQNFVQSAMHTPSSHGATVNHGGRSIPTASSDFHVYAVEWTREKMTFTVDSVVHYVYQPAVRDADTWPYTADQYILLNIAIEPGIDANFTESAMEIDYVRVYQESNTTSIQPEEILHLSYYPNPVTDVLTIELDKTIENTATIQILDLHGKLLNTHIARIENSKVILHDLNYLSKGMYVVSVRAGEMNAAFRMVKK